MLSHHSHQQSLLRQDVVSVHDEGFIDEDIPPVQPRNKVQFQIWKLMEDPGSSRSAQIFAFLSVSVILLSIITFCLETLPVFANYHLIEDESPWTTRPFLAIQLGCIIWFTLEFIFRFAVAPDRLVFLKNLGSIIYLIANIPYFFLLTPRFNNSPRLVSLLMPLAFLHTVRVIRVFQIFKLSFPCFRAVAIIGQTMKATVRELFLLFFCYLICVVIFSAVVFFAEISEEGSQFSSIPDAFWWAVITMMTVGYGDMVPVTPLGKLIGSFCAYAGVLTVALPVAVIVVHFNVFYKRDAKNKLLRSKRPASKDNRDCVLTPGED